ncbi:substrate-binding domain-containing protein [Streptomyces sp. NPDC057565]|uniref:substrate-binding domain-containing protein n=1 Tax=Streptomyces sp. NPDC057565 TaxID=3346169 RepID=UPI0036738C5E
MCASWRSAARWPAYTGELYGLPGHAVKSGHVDGLLIHNDSIALPLVSRLQASGIQIPGDLAVVTYDDELAALAEPPLTGVARGGRRSCRTARQEASGTGQAGSPPQAASRSQRSQLMSPPWLSGPRS